MLQKIEGHRESAIVKFTPYFWNKPRMASILTAFVDEIQELENAIFEVLDIRAVTSADLPRLKVLGQLVGQEDFDFTAEEYQIAIQARIAANRSNSHWADIKNMLDILAGSGTAHLIEDAPGEIVGWSDTMSAKVLSAVFAGTAVESGHSFQVHTITSGTGFTWDGIPDQTVTYYTTELG